MFDRVLGSEVRSRGRRPILFVSLLFHLLLLSALALWSSARVEPVPPPLLTVTFFHAPDLAPPPPPPPAAARAASKRRERRVEPGPAPSAPPAPAETGGGVPAPEGEAAPGGSPGGVPGGVEGSTGPATTAPPPPPAPEKPRNVPAHVLAHELLARVDFHLPPAILSAHRGETLRVAVLMCVTREGTVDRSRTRVLAGIPGTDAVVLEAVARWRYKPQPVPLCAPVHFEIPVE